MTLTDFLGALVQIAIAIAFCGALIGAVIVAIRFAWVAAPHYAVYRFPSASVSSTGGQEVGPPMPDGISWDIINACERGTDGRVIRKQLCQASGRPQGGLWYQQLKTFLDYHGL
jgi:hypothetical protein